MWVCKYSCGEERAILCAVTDASPGLVRRGWGGRIGLSVDKQLVRPLLERDDELFRLSRAGSHDAEPNTVADLMRLDRFTNVALLADLFGIHFEHDVVFAN